MIPLAAVKAHLRVDHADEDAVLAGYLRAATAYLERLGVDTAADPLPAPIEQALLLLTGEFYAVREVTMPGPVRDNPAFDRLILPYCRIVA